jgi:hypothetical protein
MTHFLGLEDGREISADWLLLVEVPGLSITTTYDVFVLLKSCVEPMFY